MADGSDGRPGVRIAIIVEGRTEKAFKPFLQTYLKGKLTGNMPKLDFVPQDGRIPTGSALSRLVERLLNDGKKSADAVIALSDVYTGTHDFADAADAKAKMNSWVGDVTNFYPHVALHDFEAWLIPYWPKIQRLAKSDRQRPGSNPETINHNNPPAYRLKEIYRIGACRRDYNKVRDAPKILDGEDLGVAVSECSELKALVDGIVSLCGGA